jgi:hypothetical protein
MVPGTGLEPAHLLLLLLGPEDCTMKAITDSMYISCDFNSVKTLGLAWTQVDWLGLAWTLVGSIERRASSTGLPPTISQTLALLSE